jgi:transcriptional regulator with XRE-family HTH domain
MKKNVATAAPAPRLKAVAKGKAATPSGKPKRKDEPVGWRRTASDQSMTQELGARMRAVRESKGLSLAQLSEKCGIPGATLSRIENNKMSPTFGVLARVMMGLEVDWIDLVGPKRLGPGERLKSFTDAGKGQSTRVRASGATVLHSHDEARTLPLLIDVHARDLTEVGGLIGHRGEEFCYVLAGTLVLHLEGEPPRIMKAGASALFDSETPHAYLSGGAAGAKVLLVVQRAFGAPSQGTAGVPEV